MCSSGQPQNSAASCWSFWRASTAAALADTVVTRAPLLPPTPFIGPRSVLDHGSACTLSAGTPSSSATICLASVVVPPPGSKVENSTTMPPSWLMVAAASAAPPAWLWCPMAIPLPTLGALDRLQPAASAAPSEGFLGADGFVVVTASKLLAVVDNVLEPELQRVHANGACNHVHMGFPCEDSLMVARGLGKAAGDGVGVELANVKLDVGDAIGTGNVDDAAEPLGGVCGVGPRGKEYLRLPGGDGSVLLDAGLDPHDGGVTGIHCGEFLGVLHDELDRPPGCLGQQVADVGPGDVHLSAERPSEVGGVGGDLLLGQLVDAGELIASNRTHLRRHPELDLALRVDPDQGGVGLYVRLVAVRRLIGALDDHVGLGKTLLDVTLGSGDAVNEIGWCFLGLDSHVAVEVRVQQGAVLLEGVLGC